MTSVKDRQAYIKSGFLPTGGMTSDVVSIMMQFMSSSPSINSTMIWTHSGGAVNRIARDATAFPHRDIGYMWEVKSIWQDIADAYVIHDYYTSLYSFVVLCCDDGCMWYSDINIAWAQKLGSALYPYFKGAYLNYIDPLLTNWQHEYYQEALPRLKQIKQMVDPTNFFNFKQSIPFN
jgi:hypothetical protein